jgi:hypothetical protein
MIANHRGAYDRTKLIIQEMKQPKGPNYSADMSAELNATLFPHPYPHA